MCTRSEWRLMEVDVWTNAIWWWSFIQIRIMNWPLHLWLVWHDWVKFCGYIVFLIWIAHSHVSIRSKTISCRSLVNDRSLESRIFIWPVWPLHLHRRIIMYCTLVTEINKMMTYNKIRTSITFYGDKLSMIAICSSSIRTKDEPLQFVHPNTISVL